MPSTTNDPHISAWAALVRAQAKILKCVERDLKEAGFPPLAWYDVLLELRTAGQGLRPAELQTRLLLEQHNVSRLIDRMEAKDLVKRLPCAEDGRGQLVELTGKGRQMQKAMWPVYRAAIHKQFGSNLSTQDSATLARLLAKFN